VFFRCKFTSNQLTPFESAQFNPIDFIYYNHCPGAIAAGINHYRAGTERQQYRYANPFDSGE
jgi:hypothetical protein